MFKFLHAADVHLDSPQRGLDRYEGAPVEECRRATRRALENLVRLAIDEKVAFVLIVGDLYDGDWPDYNTGLYLVVQMARLRDAGIPVYIIRGNHDAANRMTKDLRALDNMHVFDPQRAETRVVESCGVAIHGRSFPRRDVFDNLSLSYPDHVASLFNIGLLHTCATGREGHEKYAPCSVGDLRAKGYGYWALGHVHTRETLLEDPWIAFPGNIQGRNIREAGPKGCLLVTVDDAGEVASVAPQWLDVMRWEICRVDASEARDGDDVLDGFRRRLDGLLAGTDDRLLALRVEVAGRSAAHARIAANWPHWTEEVRAAANDAGGGRVWVEKVQAKTTPLDDSRAWADGDALAELSQVIDDLRNDADRLGALGVKEFEDLLRKLPSELIDAVSGPDRLRDLLDQIGPMLMSRLGASASAGSAP
jgi:exonuclease SbcD